MPMTFRALIVSAILICESFDPAHSEPIALRYGAAPSAIRSIFTLPILVAEREGFFAREGLNFFLIPIADAGGDKMVAALETGTVDVGHIATSFLIEAVLKGSDAVAIAAEFNNPIYSLVARRDIANYADLKGKRLGFAAATGTITLSIWKLLALHGIGAADFSVKEVEGTPARYNCLIQGECDAVPLGQPQDFFALRRGYRLLGLSTEAVPVFLYTVTAARRSWAEAHPEAVTRYVRALAGAFKFIRDPAKRDDVVRTIVDTTGSSEDSARLTLALYFEPERGVLPKQAELDLKGLAQVIAFMAEAGTVTSPLPSPERFVDLRYLRAAGLQP
jgi:ABC-type nitrate/sulfonate/bicarbonate transport system substrate-binding protein